MSIIVTSPRTDPDQYEGQVTAAPDRFEVREQIRGTGITVAVHERFGDRGAAQGYADQRTTQEPAMYGAAAAHELAVEDTVWGRRWSR